MEESAQLGRYWTQRSLERFETENLVPNFTGDLGNIWSYRILPVPKSLEPKIKKHLAKAISEVINMVEANEETPEDVKAIVLHLFNVKDSP